MLWCPVRMQRRLHTLDGVFASNARETVSDTDTVCRVCVSGTDRADHAAHAPTDVEPLCELIVRSRSYSSLICNSKHELPRSSLAFCLTARCMAALRRGQR